MISRLNSVVILCAVLIGAFLLTPQKIRAQRTPPMPLAQLGQSAPLPVYVMNEDSLLPDGFVTGSSWKFTAWTVPSSLTFTVTVDRTQGAWASLVLQTDPAKKPKWYYVPQMPGAWEKQ